MKKQLGLLAIACVSLLALGLAACNDLTTQESTVTYPLTDPSVGDEITLGSATGAPTPAAVTVLRLYKHGVTPSDMAIYNNYKDKLDAIKNPLLLAIITNNNSSADSFDVYLSPTESPTLPPDAGLPVAHLDLPANGVVTLNSANQIFVNDGYNRIINKFRGDAPFFVYLTVDGPIPWVTIKAPRLQITLEYHL